MSAEHADKYHHWMLKEIHEQPATLAETLTTYVGELGFREELLSPLRRWLRDAQGGIIIAASGSSRHAGLVAEILIENLADIAVDVEYASEFSYRPDNVTRKAAVLVISQSGETADTLAALRKATRAGQQTLAITNVASSTMAREASVSFPTKAGVEHAIPATKSFTAQLLNLYLLSLLAAESKGTMRASRSQASLTELSGLPLRIEMQLNKWETSVKLIVEQYRHMKNFLFLGRDVHYPIAREGALKLKESAYLHAEGYPSGELKHGPNALLDKDTPLVVMATVDHSNTDSVMRYQKTIQLMRDMRRQDAEILAVVNTGDKEASSVANHSIYVDEMSEPLLTICEVIPLQMLSYFMAVQNGIDVDNPRNLTKAVLTE